MKVYEGLLEHQAIKVANKCVVQLGGSPYSRQYRVNGEYARGGQQVVVEDLSAIKLVTPETKKVIGYITTDGLEVSKQDLADFHHKYSSYEGEDGGMDFGQDVETELQYVKDKAHYRIQETLYETTASFEESVDISVVGCVEDTGSDFIETPFQYGKTSFASAGVYKVLLSKIAMDEVGKVRDKFSHLNWDIPTHSHLKYLKVSGDYIFTKVDQQWVSRNDCFVVMGSLSEAQVKENQVRDYVRNTLLLHVDPKKATDVEIKDFVKSLEGIKESILGLKVKQVSVSAKSLLLRRLDETVIKYREGS